jgi:glutathione-regulated potassium-efflux system ancillary protein KefC
LPLSQQALFAIVLSQGGEFAFVLFTAAVGWGVMSPGTSDLLVGVVALSMMTTPLLLSLNQRLIEPRFAAPEPRAMEEVVQPHYNPVVIAGFGRFGQIIGRLLHANGVGTTVLDHDPEHIEMVRKFGFKVFFGDGTRLDLLYAAGADHARILVVAVDDQEQALRIVRLARDHFPDLLVLARAWDVAHVFEIQDEGAAEVERETFEGALRLGERALIRLGFTAWQAKQAAHQFRAHDEKLLTELYRHFQEDLEVRAAISMSARARLREQMQKDEVFFGAHLDADWRTSNGTPAGAEPATGAADADSS